MGFSLHMILLMCCAANAAWPALWHTTDAPILEVIAASEHWHMYVTSQVARLQYIYISRQEMEAVAEYIKKRGRIAIGELAAKSNTFIDLEAKATAVSSLNAWLSQQSKQQSCH